MFTLYEQRIADKICNLMKEFSAIDRYPKKKRKIAFLKKEEEFIAAKDNLFDIFCNDNLKRRELEKSYKLQMTKKDYIFYEDQKSRRLSVCIDKEENLTSSDLRFQRRYAEDALDLRSIPFSNKSDISESIDHELTSESEVESVSELSCSSSVGLGYESEDPCNDQNRASWPNLSLICERFQLSDRAGAAVANAVLQDLQKIVQIPALNSLLVDRSKLRRERKKFRQEALLKDEINI